MEYQNIFWDNLNEIQAMLALKDSELSELFELSFEEFSLLKLNNKSIELQRMDVFLDRIGMDLDSFFEGKFEKNQLQNFYYGPIDHLPARYNFAKFSKARTIINCLAYIEIKYGIEFKNSIVRSLNIDIRFFEDPERVMNTRLLRDLCATLKKYGLTDQDFLAMGRMSYHTNREGKLGAILRTHRNMGDLMEDMCENYSSYFDQNFDYFITGKDKGEIFIGFRPTEHALEYLRYNEMVTNQVCFTKQGVFETFPRYLDYENSIVEKTKCMLEGNSYYEYKIYYS